MKIRKMAIPSGSLAAKLGPANYSDCFGCRLKMPTDADPDDILVSMLTDMPRYVRMLFRLRNFIVKFAGLKGSEKGAPEDFERCIRQGGSSGVVRVEGKAPDETVLRLSDSHLDALISVFVNRGTESQTISLTTLVFFHNRLGRCYFRLISPFHKLVVKAMLKRAIRRTSGSKPAG